MDLSTYYWSNRGELNITFSQTNLCFSLFSSGLRYVFNLPCLDTTLFLLEWAWITPNIPYFLANGFHLEIRKSLQQIENREYSTQKRINQNAYAFNVVFYGVIWRLDHNKGIRGEYFGGRWEKVNQKIDKYFGLQPARTWHGGGRKRGSEECGIAIVHFYVFTGVLELESRNYISNKIETCFMKLFYHKLGQNIWQFLF